MKDDPDFIPLRVQRTGPGWWQKQVEENWADIRQKHWLSTGRWLPIDPPSERVVTQSDKRKTGPRKKRSEKQKKLDDILKNLIV